MSTPSLANAIWEGRFQPIHKGHLAFVDLLLQHAEHVWLVVVFNETSDRYPAGTSPVPEFTELVDPHHRAEKNPLPFWLRYRLVVETLAERFGSTAVTVWGGRRLDFDWPTYKVSLPEDRAFLTPTRDDFEDAKAAAWGKLGERVERVDTSSLPGVSATEVRAAMASGANVENLLEESTLRMLERYGYGIGAPLWTS